MYLCGFTISYSKAMPFESNMFKLIDCFTKASRSYHFAGSKQRSANFSDRHNNNSESTAALSVFSLGNSAQCYCIILSLSLIHHSHASSIIGYPLGHLCLFKVRNTHACTHNTTCDLYCIFLLALQHKMTILLSLQQVARFEV